MESEKITESSPSSSCESRHPRLQWLSQVKQISSIRNFSATALEMKSKAEISARDECSENIHGAHIANVVDQAKWAGNGIRRGWKFAALQAKNISNLNLAEFGNHGATDVLHLNLAELSNHGATDADADAAAGSPQPTMSRSKINSCF